MLSYTVRSIQSRSSGSRGEAVSASSHFQSVADSQPRVPCLLGPVKLTSSSVLSEG